MNRLTVSLCRRGLRLNSIRRGLWSTTGNDSESLTGNLPQHEHRVPLINPTLDALNESSLDSILDESMIPKDNEGIEPFQETSDDLIESQAVYHELTKVDNHEWPKTDGRLSYSYLKRDLKGYLHACINSNSIDKAHAAFVWYRYRYVRFTDPVVDVSIYNIMLKGWANIAKHQKVKEVLRLMALSDLQPNIQSYACQFLCLTRQPKVKKDQVSKIMEEMKSKSLRIEELFCKSNLNMEQRKSVEQLIHTFYPYIKFKKQHANDRYVCHVLKDVDLRNQNVLKMDFSQDDLKKWYQEQLSQEISGDIVIPSVYQEKMSEETRDRIRDAWNKCEVEWRKRMKQMFNEKLVPLKKSLGEHNGINLLPYLTVMDPQVYVDSMMSILSDFIGTTQNFGPPVSYVSRQLGYRVMNRYLMQMKVKSGYFDEINQMYQSYLTHVTTGDKINARLFCYDTMIAKNLSIQNDIEEMAWGPVVSEAVGRFLMEIIQNLKIDSNILNAKAKKEHPVPIAYTYYKTFSNKIINELRFHPVLQHLQRKYCAQYLLFETSLFPMVSPPLPWLTPSVGAYLITNTIFVREYGPRVANFSRSNLDPVLDSLNILGSVPWIINKPILDVMLRVFNEKGNTKLAIPVHESQLPEMPKKDPKLSKKEKYQLFKRVMKMRKEKTEMYSLWCDCLYKLSVADYLRDRVFWLPHNIDFRGRVYAVPPHLQQFGGDICRGLMLFADGKPIGPNGLKWLKLHLVNLTGLNKRFSAEEKLKFVDEMMPQIFDSADNPLEGDKWWMDADDPWQTLACCKEIVAAIRSGNPEHFVSHFPVHQDGSCNGLQHYAALGRDQAGAESVNLEAADRPQDVYAVVAALVEKNRINDAEGDAVPVAKHLEGFVSRKVVKQTVMTYVYGVTRFGAKLQILRRLQDMEDFPTEYENLAASYLTNKVFEAISQMFTATRDIQKWLTDCAIIASRGLGQPVKWITPLGLPVTQPYFIKTGQRVTSSSESFTSSLRGVRTKPNDAKQRNAFPPNYIHSLDSSHMMLTSIECQNNSVCFAAVHDCFWTHASSVEQMSKICRDTFINLHSEPLLSELSDHFLEIYAHEIRSVSEKYPDLYKRMLHHISCVPKTGTFQLQNVRDSPYFFS